LANGIFFFLFWGEHHWAAEEIWELFRREIGFCSGCESARQKKKEPGHQNQVLSLFALAPVRRGHFYYM